MVWLWGTDHLNSSAYTLCNGSYFLLQRIPRAFSYNPLHTAQQCMWSFTCFLLIMGKRVECHEWNMAKLGGLLMACFPPLSSKVALYGAFSMPFGVIWGNVVSFRSSLALENNTAFSFPCPQSTSLIRQFLNIAKAIYVEYSKSSQWVSLCQDASPIKYWLLCWLHGYFIIDCMCQQIVNMMTGKVENLVESISEKKNSLWVF